MRDLSHILGTLVYPAKFKGDFFKRKNHTLAVVLIVAIALLLFYSFYGSWIWLAYDVGREILVPAKLAQGDMLYRDIIYWYGPVSAYINSIFIRLFGLKVDVLNYVGLLLTLLSALSIYLLVYKLVDYFWAIYAGILFVAHSLIAPVGFSYVMPYSYAVSYGSSFLLIGVLALYFFTQKSRIPYLFIGLISISLSFASKLEFIPVVITVIIAYSLFLFLNNNHYSPKTYLLVFFLPLILGLSIWLLPLTAIDFDTFLGNILHQEMLAHHFKEGFIVRILRTYSPTVIFEGLQGLVIFSLLTIIFYLSTYLKIYTKNYTFLLFIFLLLYISLLLNISYNIDYIFLRIYPFVNILYILILLFEYLQNKHLSTFTLFKGTLTLIALSLYTRQGSVYGLWQPLSFITLFFFLEKVKSYLLVYLGNRQKKRLNSAIILTLAVMILIGVIRIPYHINQGAQTTSIQGSGGTIRVAKKRAKPIENAVNFIELLDSNNISFGPEAGWLSVLTGKIDPIRATQWWFYVEDEIISDLKKENIEYLVFYYDKTDTFFEYKPKMKEIEQFVINHYTLDQRYRDGVTIDIYKRKTDITF